LTGLSGTLSVRANISPYHYTCNLWNTSCRPSHQVAHCSSAIPDLRHDTKDERDDDAEHSSHNNGTHPDRTTSDQGNPQQTDFFRFVEAPSLAGILATEQRRYDAHSFRKHWAAGKSGKMNSPPRPISWVPLARELDQFPPQTEAEKGALEKGEVVLIDQKAYAAYTNHSRPNSWVEDQGSGVHVTVPASHEDPRPAVLRGSPFYLDRVRRKLSQLSQSYPESSTPTDANDGDVIGAIDSVRAFDRFVDRITYPYVARNVERSVYEGCSIYGGYNHYVAEALSKIFTNPYSSKHASSVALNRALHFMYHHTDLQQTASLLFAQGRRLGLVNITTYNMRLKNAISVRSRDLATATVREMRQDGVFPNSWTWATIWTAARTISHRREITIIMKRRDDTMHKKTWENLASHHLRDRLKRIEDNPDQLEAIFEELDTLFGPDWLGAEFHHIALATCSRYNLFRIASKIDEMMLERKLPVTQKARLWRLVLACRSRNLVGGVQVFRSWLLAGGYQQAERRTVVGLLFKLGWITNAANVCRLAWHFAATHGILTYGMVKRVRTHLLRKTHPHDAAGTGSRTATRQSHKASRQFCKAIISIGTDSDLTDFDTYFPRLTQLAGSVRRPVELLNQQVVTEDIRREMYYLVYVILYRDLNAWQIYAPMRSEYLDQQLQIALQQDLEWRAKDYLLKTPVETALKEACPVTISHPRTSARHVRLHKLRHEVIANIRAFEGFTGSHAPEDPKMRSLDALLAPDLDRRKGKSSLRDDTGWSVTDDGDNLAEAESVFESDGWCDTAHDDAADGDDGKDPNNADRH
jgi:hypothetical protein